MSKFQFLLIIAAVIIIVVGIVVTNFVYIVEKGDQAIITRFGKIQYTTKEGLGFKLPFIDKIHILPNKIMSWDGNAQEIQTVESFNIWVDTTARWKITDLKLFYNSLGTLTSAYGRLDNVIDPAVRNVIAGNALNEAVRNTNRINEIERADIFQVADAEVLETLEKLSSVEVNSESVEIGRKELSERMLEQANAITKDYGIELIDIVIRQIRYSDQMTRSVYARMISDRKQIAQAYRSVGQGKKDEWLGKMDREKRSILSSAYEEAEEIKGDADAQAAAVYASAYNRDPEFFQFWRAIESYKATMDKFNAVVTTDMDYFDYLYSESGR